MQYQIMHECCIFLLVIDREEEVKMRLNLRAIFIAAGSIWAFAILTTGIANLIWPGYGNAFLQTIASLYPGYDAKRSISDVTIGTLYALFDGAFCGLVFGGVYNLFVGKERK
jgi:ABC-type nitrate/sulfonate/bicarbonate transport system permease component